MKTTTTTTKKFNTIIHIIYHRMIYDTITSRSAEISFYLLLSFFPFLIFLINIISFIPVIHLTPYIEWLSKIMPANSFSIVNAIIDHAINDKSEKLLFASFVITMWSSTSGVGAIIRGINKAYDQEETRPFWKVTAISLLFTLEIVILITFSLVLIVYGSKLGDFISMHLGFQDFKLYWERLRYVTAIAAMMLTFLSLYMITPNHDIVFVHSLPGAVIATFLWIAASLIFSYYANNFSNYSILYGSIGGIIALITWIYMSSVVILLGAEINAAIYFKHKGKTKAKTALY